jgi:hypothetical protein
MAANSLGKSGIKLSIWGEAQTKVFFTDNAEQWQTAIQKI